MEDAAEAIVLTDVQLGEPWAAELRLKPCISSRHRDVPCDSETAANQ